MRSVDSRRSSASERALSDVATQRTAIGSRRARRPPPRGRATPRPARRRRAARRACHASGTACASSQSPIASSASAASSPSRAVARPRALQRLALEADEDLGVLALDARVDERRHRAVERVERVGERGRGALRRRRGVVELVREPGRHLARARRASRAGARLASIRAITGPEHADHASGTPAGVANSRSRNSAAADPGDAAGPAARSETRASFAGQREDRAHPGRRVVVVVALLAAVDQHVAVDPALEQDRERRRSVSPIVTSVSPRLEPPLLERRRPRLEAPRRRRRRTGRCRAARRR